MNNDDRWKQRFQNFESAYQILTRRLEEYQSNPHSEAFQMALIKAFEIMQELCWKTLKDYLEDEGVAVKPNPKDTIRHAFQNELVAKPEVWMESIKNRNRTTHTYNKETLHEVLRYVRDEFFPVVEDLYLQLKQER